MKDRSAAEITWAVWRALFLREAAANLSEGRVPWFWILFEPVTHVLIIMLIHTVMAFRAIPGVDTAMFFMTGLLAMLMFRDVVMNSMNAINAYSALLVYRQVKPVDCVLIRAAFRVFIVFLTSILLLSTAGLFGFDSAPDNPGLVILAYALLWLTAMGAGLILAVAARFIPKIKIIVTVFLRITYFTSGAILPISSVPQPYQSWIMSNPIAHGFESIHSGFFDHYTPAVGTNLAYLAATSIILLYVGLFLHANLSHRLVEK